MTGQALILGANGRFGSAMADALWQAGWKIHLFNRTTDNLDDAARGMDVIVNGWNPPYQHWARALPALTERVIAAARVSDARVVFPGNVYVYGAKAPDVFDHDTAHCAGNPLGRIRRDIEERYRASGIKWLNLRAGDFIDTGNSGNWFDRVIARPLSRGHIAYPGDLDAPHAWAFLPDLARAAVALLAKDLPRQIEVPFPGYTLTARDLATGLSLASGQPIAAKRMSWMPIFVAAPFSAMLRNVIEMRYLWSKPHRIAADTFDALLPAFNPTPFPEAVSQTEAVRALTGADRPKSSRGDSQVPPETPAQAT